MGLLCGYPNSGGVESGYFCPTSFGLSSEKFETSPFTFKAKKGWQKQETPKPARALLHRRVCVAGYPDFLRNGLEYCALVISLRDDGSTRSLLFHDFSIDGYRDHCASRGFGAGT